MKKITDERLILKNLQNLRISHVVLVIGVLCILGYDLFQGGPEKMLKNPLWMVLMLATIVYSYLSMSVSLEHERKMRNPRKPFVVGLVVVTVTSTTIAYLVSVTSDFNWMDGLLVGAIVFICSFIPMYYIYRLRLKQALEFSDGDEE